ncbi:MAG: hemerythrin family protein [Calothrix sp. SM1_5_4]|nr:hemerythrin family protein [Calothrix sp. SM1_5_4]
MGERMEDLFIWNPTELGLGVEEMDKEHMELITRMNSLYRAVQEKKPAPVILDRLCSLGDYTQKHFADEEAYMAKSIFRAW